ncbi:hypothetical protein [Rhizorhapis suberifaciens]|uniref:Uncharacterized protein n=1 Tax=Rhizorhapis suberifaciens TaxID=13656 RepID=A0A840HXV5_9SPHN|nr:hypothetical protein [Rhizorhapis suberifaciens]MBB4642823.1 hypothetical protein [Rhizorhapis suberifaciens]
MDPKEVDARVEMLLVMARALLIHAGTHPVSDRKVLAAGFELTLWGVLSPRRQPKVTHGASASR